MTKTFLSPGIWAAEKTLAESTPLKLGRHLGALIELNSCGQFMARDRQAYSVRGIPGLNPRTLMGHAVKIDGVAVTVAGVETHAMPDDAVIGRDFAVCIRTATNAE